MIFMVQLVLHPHGISLTFFKLDSWFPGAGFIIRKKLSFMNTKIFHTFLKMGAKLSGCPRLLIFI